MATNKSNRITIVCGCDDNYAPHAAAMLKSAEENLPSMTHIDIYVLHDQGLTEQNLQRLQATAKRANVNALAVPDSLMKHMPTEKFHRACWHRVFIADLLPNTQRVLYLDTDMIVVDDLTPLWQTDLKGAPFAAVSNPLYPFMPQSKLTELGISDPSDYLNTGCLLMDLNALRALNFSGKITAYAHNHRKNSWPEQDAISALYIGKWLKLHPRWNAQNTLFELPNSKLPYPPQKASEARQQPAIIHFIGPRKPWTYLAKHPYKGLYKHYRSKTPWANWEYPDRTLFNALIRHLPFPIQLKLERLKSKLCTYGKN